jgi:hypothetical protein
MFGGCNARTVREVPVFDDGAGAGSIRRGGYLDGDAG